MVHLLFIAAKVLYSPYLHDCFVCVIVAESASAFCIT